MLNTRTSSTSHSLLSSHKCHLFKCKCGTVCAWHHSRAVSLGQHGSTAAEQRWQDSWGFWNVPNTYSPTQGGSGYCGIPSLVWKHMYSKCGNVRLGRTGLKRTRWEKRWALNGQIAERVNVSFEMNQKTLKHNGKIICGNALHFIVMFIMLHELLRQHVSRKEISIHCLLPCFFAHFGSHFI